MLNVPILQELALWRASYEKIEAISKDEENKKRGLRENTLSGNLPTRLTIHAGQIRFLFSVFVVANS